MKYEKIQKGMTLWDAQPKGAYRVIILEMLPETREARASWNSNEATIWTERRLEKLRKESPRYVATLTGYRRERPDEKKARLAKEKSKP